MGRARRIHVPGTIHHVVNRGNNRQAIFRQERDYRDYLEVVARCKRKYAFEVFAYCLMTNHVHLLIRVGKKYSISRIMQAITVGHTKRFHHRYKTCGHVWQGRFKSPVVGEDRYLLSVMRYVEQNPVRSGMVRSPEDYAWSSYQSQVSPQGGGLIDRQENPIFTLLAETLEERIRIYRSLLGQELEGEDLDRIRKV